MDTMTKPADKRELPLSREAWQARPFEAAPPPKRARRPIALWITLGLAALLAIAAGRSDGEAVKREGRPGRSAGHHLRGP